MFLVLFLIMGCPRAQVDVHFVPWCFPGASLVPPWCLLGASSVPPRCLLGASSQSSTWPQSHLWAFRKVLVARMGSTSAPYSRILVPHAPTSSSTQCLLDPLSLCKPLCFHLTLQYGINNLTFFEKMLPACDRERTFACQPIEFEDHGS